MRLLSFILSLVISLSLVAFPTLSYSDPLSRKIVDYTVDFSKGAFDKTVDISDSAIDRSIDILNRTINVIDRSGSVINLKVKDLIQVFSNQQLLRYMETLTKSPATRFDKAMDLRYVLTREGGANHRLFDGGHTIAGSWNSVNRMCSVQGCTHYEKYNGWVKGIWKDATTPKGLPFVNMEKATYDRIADWGSKIPGVNKQYVYDALSYDVMELVVSAVAVVAIMYALNQQDYEMLSELLGSIGITSIATANPIMAIIMIATTAYLIKTGNADYGLMAQGAGIATVGFAIGSVVSMPILVEMVVMLVVLGVLNQYATKDNLINSYEVIKDYMEGVELELNQIDFNELYKLKNLISNLNSKGMNFINSIFRKSEGAPTVFPIIGLFQKPNNGVCAFTAPAFMP